MAFPSGNASHSLLDIANATFDMGYTQDPDHPQLLYQDQLNQIKSQLQITRFIVWKLIVPMTVAFGVIGNCISIAVLTRRSMHTSTNVYLSALAICDILYLIFGFSLGMKHYKVVEDLLDYWRFRRPFGMALVDTFSNTGVWLILTFTVERYIAVCHPMKKKILCTPQRAKITVIIVCMSAFILTFPEFFSYQSVTFIKDNVTSIRYEPLLEANSSYQWGFKYLHQVLFTLGPLVLLLVFNILLIRAVLSATKQRQNMAKVQNTQQDRPYRQQQKITIMLIMVLIVFLVCHLPQAITNLYYTYLDATKKLNPVIQHRIILTGNVCNLLVMINSSCNFVLYTAFSTKFRRSFKQIFCKCLVNKMPDHYRSKKNSTKLELPEITNIFSSTNSLNINVSMKSKCKMKNWNLVVGSV